MSDENLTEAELDAKAAAEAHLEGLRREVEMLEARTTPQTPRRLEEIRAELKRLSPKQTRPRAAADRETRSAE